jgi:hypothetical protein
MNKIAIISRSFWPANPAIGEALLLLAESVAKHSHSMVITQVEKGFTENLTKVNRGQGVRFATLPSVTDSSSAMVMRIVELLFFTLFVFVTLCWYRPDKVYVATNPPIFTPLAVRWYCALFGKKYYYHLQDIHPEATHVVTQKSSWLIRLLLRIDIKTTAKAAGIITLTEQMKSYINKRVGHDVVITLLSNPSVQTATQESAKPHRQKGFVYCGNAGRLQRIPLLLSAIEEYIINGGQLPFVFAGGGIYTDSIKELATQYCQVEHLGVLSGAEAADLLLRFDVGLMPIDDEVTHYAFPSKSSSYAFSGCHIMAICDETASVASWVKAHELGFVVGPDIDSMVELFHKIEQQTLPTLNVSAVLREQLTPEYHANELEKILMELS